MPEKNIEGSPVPVWLPFNIAHKAQMLTTRTPPSAADIERINALLGRRAAEQRAVEESKKRGKRA